MKFDIILPTIGRESLKRAIESVIGQTYQDWNLWIVADKTDLHQAWPMSLDDRIVVYNLPNDSKVRDHSGARARNFGIEAGHSEWIAYIDDDDEWLPHHLATLVNLSKENPEANMLRTAGQSFSMKHRSPRSSKKVRKMGSINSTDILTVGMAHKRELFNRTDGWLPFDNHDLVLWRQMKLSNGRSCESSVVTFYFER